MIHLKDITYTYPHATAPAVMGISLSVGPGKALVCTGRSGCGKSTLLRVINGLAPHYLKGSLQGSVIIAGKPTGQIPPAKLAEEVGTLFQDPERQFFALSVKDEIALALQWRGWSPDKVQEAVTRSAGLLGIEQLLEQTIFGLSEGQKQKVALASLLASEPGLLILDEPSANLDPEATEELAKTLSALKKKGVALVIVDHRLHWLRELADEVMVLDAGRCVANGPFSILDDAEFREKNGLRNSNVTDPRHNLPHMPQADLDDSFVACRDLSFGYNHENLLFSEANHVFSQGEIVALTGENGVGKTTLARLLTGLEKPSHGAVVIQGKMVPHKKLTSHVQVVLQNAGHQLRMNSVEAELIDAAALHGRSKEYIKQKAYETLGEFGLLHLKERHPQSLSGGEKQRLAVACAAIRSPKVLILDEPTSGLDGENMHRMGESIKAVARNGASVIVITHDLELMAEVCTCKLVLENAAEDETLSQTLKSA